MTMRILERLVFPCMWKLGGPKQISYDAVIPLILIPALTLIAAQNLFCTIIIIVITPIVVNYLHQNFLRFLLRSKFFLMWTIVSVAELLLVFELCVVPLLEILPEENFFFISCVCGGLICGLKTRQKADQISAENTVVYELELGDGIGEMCNTCKIKTPPKTYHCRICQTCILGREYHCKWLDCCIGANNLRWYLACLLCSAISFIYGSNLTMTSVCHPFILVATILLPDDCSDVYHQLDLAICFVSSVYSLIVGLIVFYYFIYHLWFMYFGSTTNERRIIYRTNQSEL